MLQRPEHLADPGLAGMRSYEDVLDVLGLWGSSLQIMFPSALPSPGRSRVKRKLRHRETNLNLGSALDGLFERASHRVGLPSAVGRLVHAVGSTGKKGRGGGVGIGAVQRRRLAGCGVVTEIGRRQRVAAVEAGGIGLGLRV